MYSRLFAWRGALGLIPAQMDHYYVSNEFPSFRIDQNKILPKFLEMYFQQKDVWKKIESFCTGTTKTSRNRFKEKAFLDFEIPLPLIQEQEGIVAQIEYYRTRIGQVRKTIASQQLEISQLLLSTYHNIVTDAIFQPMSEVAPIIRRPVHVVPSDEYHELGIRSFGEGTFHKPAISGSSLGEKRIFWIRPGDMLFNNVFAWEGAVAVAKQEDDNRVGSHRFITCLPKEGAATARFLCFYFLTQEGLDQLKKASPGGAGRNRTLGLRKLEKILVPTPKFEKQVWFDELLKKAEEVIFLKRKIDAELPLLFSSTVHYIIEDNS